MRKDGDHSVDVNRKPRIERVRVPSSEREIFLCFDYSNKRGIHVEVTNGDGKIQKIKVIYYHQSKPEAKLNSNKNGGGSVELFNGIKYEKIVAENGMNYCCRTFAGRRYCRLIKGNESCDGSVFLN